MDAAVLPIDAKDPPKYVVDPSLMPDIESLKIEDDEPVDNFHQDSQRRLLVNGVHSSWEGPGEDRPWICASDIGVFTTAKAKPIVPDVLLSVDVARGTDISLKENLSYFVWILGKVPDVAIEIVSNREGEEDTRKFKTYQAMRVPYYAIFDPQLLLSREPLRVFRLNGAYYVRNESGMIPEFNLGLRLWKGGFEHQEAEWLRWTDGKGKILACGNEKAIAAWNQVDVERKKAETAKLRADAEQIRADAQKQEAEMERQRAETEKHRADRLAEKLRELGVDPG